MKGKTDSMDDQKQMEDRWRELDELLGLAPAAPKSEKLPEPPPPAPVVHEAPAAEERQPWMEENSPPLEVEPSSPPQAEWEAEFDDDADTEVVEVPGSFPDRVGRGSQRVNRINGRHARSLVRRPVKVGKTASPVVGGGGGGVVDDAVAMKKRRARWPVRPRGRRIAASRDPC